MKLIIFILQILNWLLLIYFLLSAIYLIILAIAGHFFKSKKHPKAQKLRHIAVLIPAYKEDSVILNVATEALKQDYPKTHFDIIIIADLLQEQTIHNLNQLNITLLEINADKSSKANALNYAFHKLNSSRYDIGLILDADNLMTSNFLHEINNAFEAGNTIIQAHRTAKNLNNSMALLDAVSEEVNNHIFRKGHRALGLSSILIGSGMAFQYDLLVNLMGQAKTSFEDKEVEFKLLENHHIVEYLHDSLVYDEKVQKSKVFQNQRTRWIYSQIYFFKLNFLGSFRSIFADRNINLGIKSFETILPPRLLLIGFSFLIFLINLLYGNQPSIIIWGITFVLSISTIILSIPSKFFNAKLLVAILHLPKTFIHMILAALNARSAAKKFIHTDHSGVENIK